MKPGRFHWKSVYYPYIQTGTGTEEGEKEVNHKKDQLSIFIYYLNVL